jgi:hypothetical protein
MFCKHLLVCINSKVPFHENLPPLPSHRSGVPERALRIQKPTQTVHELTLMDILSLTLYMYTLC